MKPIEDIQFLRRLRIGGATIILGGLVICIPILAMSDLLGLALPVFFTLAFAFAL